MHLLSRGQAGHLSLAEFFSDDIPAYAILSHRWSNEEPSFKDITEQTGQNKSGYSKLELCEKQATRDGLKYFWVDTVCIDKSSSAELTEALNSMFRWYRESARCYVDMPDVVSDEDFPKSQWFSRGWTLQELLAPRRVDFFGAEWRRLGRSDGVLEQKIQQRTRIPFSALRGQPLSDHSVEERLSWLADRTTTRSEDRAYCLLGIFDVTMPVIYGEGQERAFARLEDEIERMTTRLARVRQPLPYLSSHEEPTSTPPVSDKLPSHHPTDKLPAKPTSTPPISDKLPSQHLTDKPPANESYNCQAGLRRTLPGIVPNVKTRIRCDMCKFEALYPGHFYAPIWEKCSAETKDGLSLNGEVVTRLFHHRNKSTVKAKSYDSYFRCFLCQDGLRMEVDTLKKHIKQRHTYSDICGVKKEQV